MSDNKLTVSSSPHIRSKETSDGVMTDVVIALLPATFMGCYLFGIRALIVVLVSVLSCVLFEFLWQKITKTPVRIGDMSAVVTGMILALALPATIPLWQVIVGAFVAIIIAKQMFGGIGDNFVNPAAAARAFMLAAFPVDMTKWVIERVNYNTVDAVTSATPLGGNGTTYTQLLLGYDNTLVNAFTDKSVLGGCIGETCAVAILIGAVYLLIRRVISIRTPLSYLLTVAVFYFAMGKSPIFGICTGSVLFASVFMATDYVTSPTTKLGQVIMGIGCGLITCIIRFWGGYPEGVTYAILFMNVLTPLIEKWTMPKVFGRRKRA